MRSLRQIPRQDTRVRSALRAIDVRVRPDFRRAIACAALAFVLDAVGHAAGGVHAESMRQRLIAYGAAAGFVVLGVIAARSAADELTRVSLTHAGAATANPLRVVVLLVGYLIVALIGIDLFALPLGHLLVGGAVTGIILGIAAQQSLSNVFAGLLLLLARPYIPGERVRVRAGSLGGGGILDGTVSSVGLLYTTLSTAEGVVNIPNATLTQAAVGPLPPEEQPDERPDRQLASQRDSV